MYSTLLITVLVLGAPAPKNPPKKDTIVGEWITERSERGGKDISEEQTTSWVFAPEGTFQLRSGGKIVMKPWLHSIDLKAKPMTIDIRMPNDDDPPTFRGIMKFNGDKLIICLADIEKPRPSEFAAKAGTKDLLTVIKRVKKKD